MNAVHGTLHPPPYAAGRMAKPIHFYCAAPAAKSVSLVGDFNHWHPAPMHRHMDGEWFLEVWLTHGHHLYQFLVDGRPILDPNASGTARSERNELASLLAVS